MAGHPEGPRPLHHCAGERNPTAKLTAPQVVAIRERCAAGESRAALAREYGVNPVTVGQLVGGRIWRHVGGPIQPIREHRLSRTGSLYCPVDGYELEDTTDRLGRVTARCRACERRKAGRCVDCGTPVQGKAWRCAAHQRAAVVAAIRASAERHREERNRAQRDRYRKLRGKARQEHLDYKREWRRKNRRKVLMQKRRARLAGKPNGYATPEKYAAYQRAYRERNREAIAAKVRAYYRRKHPIPDPRCRECGGPVPWDGRHRPRAYCEAHAPAWRVWMDRRDQQPRSA